MKTQDIKVNAEALLDRFVDQRPCMEFADYGDWSAYAADRRSVTKDRRDYYELQYVYRRLGMVGADHTANVTRYLQQSSGRLTLDSQGRIQYITGQYFPTEYRAAACRVYVYLIRCHLLDDRKMHPSKVRGYIYRNFRSVYAWFK